MTMTDPTDSGRFGDFGGMYVPETLVPACQDLDKAFRAAWADPAFRSELDHLLQSYAGRPSPLTECHNLSEELGCRVLRAVWRSRQRHWVGDDWIARRRLAPDNAGPPRRSDRQSIPVPSP